MEASAMNYLIRCFANSTNVAENGYTMITFDDWDELNGELDSDILQQLADASPNAVSYSLANMRSLSSDEQIQLIGFSTMLLDSSSSLTTISIKEISQLTADQTESIFNDWMQTTHIEDAPLTKITLEYADFSTEDSAVALASFIDIAAQVEYLYLEYQALTRPVIVNVTPATLTLNDAGTIQIVDATTALEIISMDTTRTAMLSVEYGVDLYTIMAFPFTGLLRVNGAFVIERSESPTIYTCDSLTSVISIYHSSWDYFYLDYTDMQASYLNAFYYCMANSSHRSDIGYNRYRFEDMTDMNGLMDPTVFSSLATAAEQRTYQYTLKDLR